MAIQNEIWARDIAANIFKNNMWIRQSRNDDAFVENKTVHLPQSGSVPTVERNRSSLPATITERTDAIVDYSLVEFTSDPTLIRDIDAIEVSYDKRSNVLMEHIDQINDECGTYLGYVWAPASAGLIVDHTSSATRTSAAPGSTATVKRLTKEDIMNAKAILDGQDIPQEGRVLLLNSQAYNDLLRDDKLLSADYMNRGNLPTGAIGNVLGFNVFIRSLVGRYPTASATPKDPTAANATTDLAFSLAWHPRFVRTALGSIKVYADEDKPEYYGSIFSAMVRCGGSKSYTSHRGVVALREAT